MSEWSMKVREEWADLLDVNVNVNYTVLASRINKAQNVLNSSSIAAVFEANDNFPCTCQTPCENTVSRQLVIDLRLSLCVRTKKQQYDDILSKLHAINVDSMEINKNLNKKHNMIYKIHNVYVCRNFFARALWTV